MSTHACSKPRRSAVGLRALGALALASVAASASAATFSDGEFAVGTWTRTVIGTGSSSAARVTTGGNPGAFLSITNVTDPGEFVFGIYLNSTAIYSPSQQGAIESIDYDEDARFISGGGNHQAGGIAIRQDGVVYVSAANAYTNSEDWSPLLSSALSLPTLPVSFAGLDATDFIGVVNAALHPDFSVAGSIITFGFFRANSGSNTRISGIDNWSVTIKQATAPVPLPAAVWGQLAALALLWCRRRAAV